MALSVLALDLLVLLVDADCNETSTGCDLRWSVIEEQIVVQSKLADLVSRLMDGGDSVVAHESEVSLQELDWTWEVEIEAQFD